MTVTKKDKNIRQTKKKDKKDLSKIKTNNKIRQMLKSLKKRNTRLKILFFIAICFIIIGILGFLKIINLKLYNIDYSLIYLIWGFGYSLLGLFSLNKIIKEVDIDISDLFSNKIKYTFLVGAGISVNKPSLLPFARNVVDSLIKWFTLKQDYLKIIQNKNLRYELIIELIHKNIDSKLRFMDYFDEFKNPNLIHFFLACLIKKGNYVMTTNYDNLIECALSNVVEDKSSILPIITEEDFENFTNPEFLIESGKYPIYKIHGSNQNIIESKDTKKSIITTTSDLGRDRDLLNPFRIESYKLKAIKNLTTRKTLLIMGYSGSDSFDITPLLTQMPLFSKIIWINHTDRNKLEFKSTKFKIYKIKIPFLWSNPRTDKLEHLDKLLTDISISNKWSRKVKIYRIDTNTEEFIDTYLWSHLLENNKKPKVLNIHKNPINFYDWIKSHYGIIKDSKKFQLAFDFYKLLSLYDDAFYCAEKKFKIAKKNSNQKMKAYSFLDYGEIYELKSEYSKALEYYEKTLKIAEDLNDTTLKIKCRNRISTLYLEQGRYLEAMITIEETVLSYRYTNIINQDIISDLSILYYNIGLAVYYKEGNWKKAFKNFSKALEIANITGNLEFRAKVLCEIGRISKNINPEQSIDILQNSLKIAEELGNIELQIKSLFLLGDALVYKIRVFEAIRIYYKAFKLKRQFKKMDPQKYQIIKRSSYYGFINAILMALLFLFAIFMILFAKYVR